MRLIFSVLLFCLTVLNTSQAQTDSIYAPRFDISERAAEMSEGTRAALVLRFPEEDKSTAKNLWQDYMKDFGGKTKKKGLFSSEFITTEAHIYAVGGVDPIDVYAQIEVVDDGMEVIAWFRVGENDFINSRSHQNAYGEALRFMDDFAYRLKSKFLEMAVEEEQKKLSSLEKEIKSLKRDEERLNKRIESAKKTIEESEKSLVENAADQEDMADKLIEQQRELEKARQALLSVGQ